MSIRKRLAFAWRWSRLHLSTVLRFRFRFASLKAWNWSFLLAFLPLLMCAVVPPLLDGLGRLYSPEHISPTYSSPMRGLHLPDGLYSYLPWQNFEAPARDLNLPRKLYGSPTYFVLLDISVLITGILLLCLRGFERRGVFFSLVLVFGSILLMTSPVIFSEKFPTRDTYLHYYPTYHYIAQSLASGALPEWLPVGGGARLGYSHMNLCVDSPHRLVGYLLYAVLPVSVMTVYKLQFALGAGLSAWGWWLVFARWTGSRRAAYVGALAIAVGSLATFHQEQILTFHAFLPWFVLALLRLRDSPLYLIAAGIIFGLAIGRAAPHVQLMGLGAVGLGMAIHQRKCLLGMVRHHPIHVVLAVTLIPLGLLPLGYMVQNLPNLRTFHTHHRDGTSYAGRIHGPLRVNGQGRQLAGLLFPAIRRTFVPGGQG